MRVRWSEPKYVITWWKIGNVFDIVLCGVYIKAYFRGISARKVVTTIPKP